MRTETEPATGSLPGPRSGASADRSAGIRPARLGRALKVRFRLHGATDPAPDQRRLAMVAAWAAALGFGGAIVALRLWISLFQPDGGWYPPTVTVIGAAGVLATVGAFASVHRQRLPWLLLGAATVALIAAFAVTIAA